MKIISKKNKITNKQKTLEGKQEVKKKKALEKLEMAVVMIKINK